MSELDVQLAGKSLADYTNTQLRLALGAVLYTNTADMWKKYLNQIGYTGDVAQMLQKYYVDYSVPSNFRNYINAGASIFNPQHLFLSGEQGYVYDINDLSTLFLDSALTTPATVNGLVGGVVDKSGRGNHATQATTGNKPVLRGTPVGGNLVTNGDFASGTAGWVASANATVSNVANRLRIAAISGGVDAYASLAFPTTVGKVYRTTVQYATDAGTGNAFIYIASVIGGAAIVNRNVGSTVRTYVDYFTATSTTTYISLASSSAILAGEYHEWDNIEIVDVSAGSVQAPYALQFDGVDDFLQTASVNFATVTSDGLARRNLLTFPSAFDNAAWTSAAVGSVAVANQVAAPDGTLTADLLREDTSTGNHYNSQSPTVTNTAHTFSVYYKIASGTRKLALYHAGTNVGRQFDATGVISAGVFNTPAGGFGVEAIGNGWYRAWITTTPAAGSGAWRLWLVTSADALSYTGDGASGFYVWGAQVEAGSTPSAFQDIGTDKMTVCHGVRKLSDAALGVVVELGTSVFVNAGAFWIAAPDSAANNLQFRAGGTSTANLVRTGLVAPTTFVVLGKTDISGDSLTLRVNQTETTSSGEQGTGNLRNDVLYFGRRAGTSNPFNGLMFSSICVGKATSASELANIERWVNLRTGAY